MERLIGFQLDLPTHISSYYRTTPSNYATTIHCVYPVRPQYE